MSKIFVARVRVAGEYRDAWLYKRRLYMWDRLGVLKFADLESVGKYLTKTYGASISNVIQTLIFRNDWKVGEQFRAMMRVPDMEAAFLLPYRDSDSLTVDLPHWLFSRSESESYGGLVLDTQIYADRVYLATPEGLLESYVNASYPDRGYPLNQQTDFRVSKVSVRYAAINLSAEERGLYFARVRFASGGIPGFRQSSWTKVADSSMSTSHSHRNLLNYTGDAVPRFLAAKIEESKTHEAARYEESQVIGYKGEADLSSVVYSAATSANKVSTKSHSQYQVAGEFEVLGNTNNHLLVGWNGKMRVIDIRTREGDEIEAKPSPRYQGASFDSINPEDVLQTYPVSGGFVVELYDSLRLIVRDGSFELSEGQAARVRTFASSLRHREAVAVVNERDVVLVGYYMVNETLF
ncbi:hypothetical protein [Micromonospora sp. NPDC005220]|uniref:hypothetical protein n=1 Tax=Micromonospora sp. NPDC005220 TaxID=3155589 RepID=UPI0033ACB85F